MNAVLIKPGDEKIYSQLMQFLRIIKAPAKVLSEDEELDLFLVGSIERGMKTGAGSKAEVRKFFYKKF